MHCIKNENKLKMKKVIILTFCVLGYTLGQAQVNNEEQNAKELLQKAAIAYSNDFYELALEYYNEAEKYYSKYFDADAYVNMGASYDSLGNYNQAIKCYQKVIVINPNNATAFFKMGLYYRKLDNYNQTITSWQKAARLGHKGAQDFLNSNGISW